MSEPRPVRMTKGSVVYPQVARALSKLGSDIAFARRIRRITAEEFARRMGVSRATLHRLENGDPGISLNTLSMAMFILGQLQSVADLAEQTKDEVGLMLACREAPKRVRRPRPVRVSVEEDQQGPQPSGDGGFVGW